MSCPKCKRLGLGLPLPAQHPATAIFVSACGSDASRTLFSRQSRDAWRVSCANHGNKSQEGLKARYEREMKVQKSVQTVRNASIMSRQGRYRIPPMVRRIDYAPPHATVLFAANQCSKPAQPVRSFYHPPQTYQFYYAPRTTSPLNPSAARWQSIELQSSKTVCKVILLILIEHENISRN